MVLPPKRLCIPGLALAGLLCVLGGCNLSTSEEDLNLLLGSWRVEDVSVDGISVKARLDAQYAPLVLTLRESGGDREFFTLVGQGENAERDLFVQGTFRVESEQDELLLSPNSGPFVELNYIAPDAEGSRLRLSADEGESEDRFLTLIGLPVQGEVDRLEIRLSKDDGTAAQQRLPNLQ